MKLDYVSIFPDYFAPLSLSLPGKALARGLIDTAVHDLRSWTTDRHRTVDDTPYGGGAGMVMKPEPWGDALDHLLRADGTSTLVVPTPAGRLFDQRLAAELATREHLVFACGRYEGIDIRVLEEAADRCEVVEVSLGDYVLNGGEVAALAVTEAVIRLLPGFMGNEDSLAEESFSEGALAGLVEYPGYTKPASWRGRDVPADLMSGDHARIAAWRLDAARRRTAERRPDLLLEQAAGPWSIEPATPADAPELHVLSLACWVTEALVNDDLAIPTLHETPESTRASLAEWTTWLVREGGRLIGSVRSKLTDDLEHGATWDIGRLMVSPDRRGGGLGRVLLEHAEAMAPEQAQQFRLITGKHSEANLRRYKRAGYRAVAVGEEKSGPVTLVKGRS